MSKHATKYDDDAESWINHDQFLPVIGKLHRGTCNAFRRTRYHVISNYASERRTILPMIYGHSKFEEKKESTKNECTENEQRTKVVKYRSHKSAPNKIISYEELDSMFKTRNEPKSHENDTVKTQDEKLLQIDSLRTLASLAQNDYVDRRELLYEIPAVKHPQSNPEHTTHVRQKRSMSIPGNEEECEEPPIPVNIRSKSSLDDAQPPDRQKRSSSRVDKTQKIPEPKINVPTLNVRSKRPVDSPLASGRFCGWEIPQTPFGEMFALSDEYE
jgi:hypothetical protein